MSRKLGAVAAVWAGVLASAQAALATTVPVSDAASLQAAIAAAQAGDTLLLADGFYALPNVNCTASGTPSAPITVAAARPGGAVITFDDGAGHSTAGFQVQGSDWHFVGLRIQGGCQSDTDCDNAFHVVGSADRFELLDSEIVDFNSQLKVNATPDQSGAWIAPAAGIVEGNEVHDTHPRSTSNPVDKLDIDAASGWIVRANFIHDGSKNGGDDISYLAFMKGGGANGVFERNLVVCAKDLPQRPGEARLGLSFGGGGTGAQYCAPYFDAGGACTVEHSNGLMANNIIASCSDVGIYLNQSANSQIFDNTLIANNGIDCRFPSTTGLLQGNVMSAQPNLRNGGTCVDRDNLEHVSEAQFASWFVSPLTGDLRLSGGSLSALVGQGSAIAAVANDYCLRPRSQATDLGALLVSLGDCDPRTPPIADGGSVGEFWSDAGTAIAGGSDAGAGLDAGLDLADGGGSADAGSGNASDAGTGAAGDGGAVRSGTSNATGGCQQGGDALALGAFGLLPWLRKRRRRDR